MLLWCPNKLGFVALRALRQVSLDNPVIVAAIVSALVAGAILGIREFVIEPRREREKTRKIRLERRVAIYGTILTILEIFQERAKVYPQRNIPHLFHQFDEYEGLRKAIGRARHLLSKEVTDTWIKSMSKFKFDTKKDIGDEPYFYEDLSELQKIVAEEYADLKTQYEAMVKSQDKGNKKC